MSEEKIKIILDKLGSSVGNLSEQNRLCKIRDNAAEKLIQSLDKYIKPKDWLKLYNQVNDIYVKELMLDWGKKLFPDNFDKDG